MKFDVIKFAFFTILILQTLNAPVFPWDETGHKVTAYIAWQHMTPTTRARVFNIIMDAPEDSDLSKVYDRFNSRSEATKQLEQFMFASIWPDVVKNRGFENRNKKYDQGNWHYSDIFWKQENGNAIRLQDFDGAGGLAVPKLGDFERIMSGPSFPNSEKALAIAWFLHVGGDLHNPVHNASRVTDEEPKGDQGGNMFVFVPRTENSFGVNLHSYWDGIISRVRPRKNDACDVEYISGIGRKIRKKYKYKELAGGLNLDNFKDWNDEGFAYLNSYVYESIERNKMPSRKYEKRAHKLAEKQIALAGYRLGETLERIFGPPEGISECRIISQVQYPVSKTRTPNQKPTYALLDLCPPNRGLVARPTITLSPDSPWYEYDVIRTFDNEEAARAFAKKSNLRVY